MPSAGAPGFLAATTLTYALGTIGRHARRSSACGQDDPDRTLAVSRRRSARLHLVGRHRSRLPRHAPLAGPEIAEFQQRATSFERIGGIWATTATLGAGGDPEQLRIATVTPDFFPVLGVDAALGHAIGAADFGQTVTPLLLSHALWTTSFGADPAVAGRSITLKAQPATVIGVMPQDFVLHFPPDAAVPPDLEGRGIPGSAELASQPRGQQYLRVVGVVKPDLNMRCGTGGSDSDRRVEYLGENPGSYSPGWRFYAAGMQDDTVRPVRQAMLAMFGGVLILLVIACVNIAGLLIVSLPNVGGRRRGALALRRQPRAAAPPVRRRGIAARCDRRWAGRRRRVRRHPSPRADSRRHRCRGCRRSTSTSACWWLRGRGFVRLGPGALAAAVVRGPSRAVAARGWPARRRPP